MNNNIPSPLHNRSEAAWKNTIQNRIAAQHCPCIQSRHCNGVGLYKCATLTINGGGTYSESEEIKMPCRNNIMSLDEDDHCKNLQTYNIKVRVREG